MDTNMNMNLLVNDVALRIKQVSDYSDTYVSRLRVDFLNGYSLSIIRGWGTYGSAKGLFEIAVIKDDKFVTRSLGEMRGLGDTYDDVMGWQTEDEVRDWAVFVANLSDGG